MNEISGNIDEFTSQGSEKEILRNQKFGDSLLGELLQHLLF